MCVCVRERVFTSECERACERVRERVDVCVWGGRRSVMKFGGLIFTFFVGLSDTSK